MSRRSGIQLAYPFEEKRLLKWGPPYLVQPKLDGVRCRGLCFDPSNSSGYSLLSSEENIIFGMRHIEEALDQLPFSIELDGELYSHGMSFEEIFSRTSREVNYHPESEQIGYYIFDICNEEMPQLRRLTWLKDQMDYIRAPLWLVPTTVCTTLDEIMETLRLYTLSGYEGIIVRHHSASYLRRRSTWMMKWKPKCQDEYLIVGWKEEVDKHGVSKGRLGALICTSGEEEFSVGSGFTEDERVEWWPIRDSLIGKTCIVDYQHLTTGHKVPRHPVVVSIK